MRLIRKCLLFLIIPVFVVGCQQTLVAVEPTEVSTFVPPQAMTLRPTPTPQQVNLPTATVTPISLPISPTLLVPTQPLQPPPVDASAIDLTAIDTILVLPPPDESFVIGQSVEGRDILAYRFGTGERILLLVGGIHTGFETNTVMLVNELVTHFQSTPADILPGMSLVLIPVANPDGLVVGREAAGRFNANRVDLNRNWGCEWEETAYWRNQQVDPGAVAFSEPETRAIAEWIRNNRPGAVVFYHAAARGVFAGSCEGDHGSAAFAAVIGEASGYPYGVPWSAYPVSGTASTWVDGLGIPAVDLELSGTRETEFLPNLRGIIAAQCWLVEGQAAALPGCDP
jgi:hypothetical protein